MSKSLIAILNGIRANGSEDYQNYVPLATRTNLEEVGSPIIEYKTVENEFLNNIINKVAMTIVRHKLLSNPLAPLKKGEMPLGMDIEEMHVNRARATTFDPTGAGLLARKTPDVAVMYHRLNRQDEYQVTVSRDQLRQAFTSWDNLQKLLDGIVSSMYDGDSDDEFILMKNLMSDAIANDHIVTTKLPYLRDVDGKVDQVASYSVVETFKNASSYFQFAGSSFNKFHVVNPGQEPRRLKTELEDQIIIIRADLANTIDVNVLANAFNMSKAEFLANRVIVDNFGAMQNVGAFLCDKDFFQVYDQLRTTEEFWNPKGLYWNYFYHVWQVVSYSLLTNAIAFLFEDIVASVTKVTPTVATVLGPTNSTVTVTFKGTVIHTEKLVKDTASTLTFVTPPTMVVGDTVTFDFAYMGENKRVYKVVVAS